jgi:Spy/CpxP family protein refolding chaperone
MRQVSVVLALVLAVLVLGTSAAQDTKKPAKGKIPTGWVKLLKLTKDQGAKIREIDLKATQEVAPLLAKVAEIRGKARQDQLAVLTPAQRKTLAGSVDEVPPDKKPKD